MSAGLITPIGILTFVHIFEAYSGTFGQEPKFSCNILFDEAAQRSPEYKALKDGCFQAGVREWGESRMRDSSFVSGLRLPFRPAGEKAGQYEGYEEGMVYIAARAKDRPGVVDARRQEINVPGDVWSGQLGRLFVSPFAYNVNGNKGMSFGLNHVQIARRDMPRLDGRVSAQRAFPEIDEELVGAGDESPF